MHLMMLRTDLEKDEHGEAAIRGVRWLLRGLSNVGGPCIAQVGLYVEKFH